MKKNIVKILALVLVTVVFFSGCNSTGSSSGDEGSNTTSQYTVEAKGSVYADGILLPELSEKQAKITYMTNTTWEFIQQESTETSPTAIYHAMMIWKETYGVDVEIKLIDWDSFTNHLISSVASGEGPDVLRYTTHPIWINSNLLSTLDDKMNFKEEGYDMDVMNSYSIDDHIYAVYSKAPYMPNKYIIFNKTKFVQAGEKTPMEYYKEGNWTMTQLLKSAKKLTSAASDSYGFTGTGLYPEVAVLNADKSVTSLIKDSAFQKFFSIRADLYNSGSARTIDNQGTNHRETVAQGKDAMYLASGGLEYAWLIEKAKLAGTTDEFGIAPAPIEDEIGETKPRGKQYTYDGFSMSLHSNNQEGAIEFLRLVTLVGSNISEKLGEYGQMSGYMTEEEKEVFRNIEYQDTSEYFHNGTVLKQTGIAGLENNYNKYILAAFKSGNTKSVSQLISEMSGPLDLVILEYEISVGISK